MDAALPASPLPPIARDYSLVGVNSTLAIERGLAEADWYRSPVPRDALRRLLTRRDGPALRDTGLWVLLIGMSAFASIQLWDTWWFLLPYAVYSALYATTSDSRWHETGHGTAFKTDWMNNALYELSSFMVMREAVVWRWSHTRHHSDTIIVGRDPEIATPRPTKLREFFASFFGIGAYRKYFPGIAMHAVGRMSAEERTFIPETEFRKVYWRARLYLGIYIAVAALAIAQRSLLPLMMVGLVNLFGTWLMVVYGFTQHAGLAENVLDHRLNCRTVYMNPVNRFCYWNMNYHVEHHMFPLVPYHALPALHALVKDDCAPPYSGLWSAWSEIIPAILKQIEDPVYHVKRVLPTRGSVGLTGIPRAEKSDAQGWVLACSASSLREADAVRFDHGTRTFAIYRDEAGALFASDGICTHGNTHLADGLVKGGTIECPKHNGRFRLVDGAPARPPVCRALATYPLEEREGNIYINLQRAGGLGARVTDVHRFRVLSNDSVSTFVKELILEPIGKKEGFDFSPGDYIQLDIPKYDKIRFADFDIPEPYASVWRQHHLFDVVSRNPDGGERRNNYSLASNRVLERTLRLNVRLATAPPGQECAPGVGSSYVFSLKPGDMVRGVGPFGDFHIKPTQREMVYIGRGAGMAPLRAHLSHLLETEGSARKISFWYGARSRQELFYEPYFRSLEARHPNFRFHTALSSPLTEDEWDGYEGSIHEVVRNYYLQSHAAPHRIEFYLCGPPMMILACKRMLAELGAPLENIAYDEF